MKTNLHTVKYLVLATAIALGTSACGDKESGGKPAATQVAAKVNASEISVHQINAVLAKTPGVTAETAGAARKEILDKLIDQQLAYDQAVEKKLDRSPEVMTAIEFAKREIVARAYMEQLLAAQGKPTDNDAKQYYAANPNLFSNRRVFNLQEIVMEPKAEVAASLKQMVSEGKSMDDIAAFLKGQSVQFRGNASTRAAEQIPFDVLTKLAALSDGQSMFIEAPQGFTVMRVAASQRAPVDEATAKPRILQFLQNQRAQKMAQEEIARLKGTAKIEYLGEFVGGAVPAAPVKPAPAAPAKPAEGDKAAASNLEKGVAGLK